MSRRGKTFEEAVEWERPPWPPIAGMPVGYGVAHAVDHSHHLGDHRGCAVHSQPCPGPLSHFFVNARRLQWRALARRKARGQTTRLTGLRCSTSDYERSHVAEIGEAALQRVSEAITRQVELRLDQVLARVQGDLEGRPRQEVRQVLAQRIRDEVPLYRLTDDALDKWTERCAGASDRSAASPTSWAHSRQTTSTAPAKST
jgi:hypothetical protein